MTHKHPHALHLLAPSVLTDDTSYTERRQSSAVPNTRFARSRTQLVRRGYVTEIKEGQRKSYTISTEGQSALGTKYRALPRGSQSESGTDTATSTSANRLLKTASMSPTQVVNGRAETAISTPLAGARNNPACMQQYSSKLSKKCGVSNH